MRNWAIRLKAELHVQFTCDQRCIVPTQLAFNSLNIIFKNAEL